MNGRIYDPTLGRFLQADPHIQAPTNSQNYNRYSYVLNNPLSYTDPSGYFFKSLWKGVKNAFRAIAKVPILNAALQFAACSFGGPAGCAAYAAISTYAVTGSLKGALIGAFTAGIGGGQGFFTAGLIGGLASRAQGGNFGHGFWSAGIGALVGGKIRTGNAYMNVVVSAVIGGTVSKLTGGKFANGAQTWAFSAAMAQDWGSNEDVLVTGAGKVDASKIKSEDIARPEIDYSTGYETYGEAVEALEQGIISARDNGNSDWEYGGITTLEDGVYYNSNIVTSHQKHAIYWSRTTLDSIATRGQISALHHYHPLHRGVMKRAFSDADMNTFNRFRSAWGEGFKAVYLIDKYGTRKYDGTTTGRRGYRGIACKEGIASC